MKIILFPIFESIFPGEPIPLLPDILNKMSSSKMLAGIAFLNSKIHLKQNDLKSQELVFSIWIKGIKEETRKKIQGNYILFKESHQEVDIVLFNSMPLIRLMEQIIIHYNKIPETSKHTEEEQLLILKAWLIANQSFRFEVPENSIPNSENLFEAIVVNKSIQYEFIRPKKFIYQILYGAAFFQYFEEHDNLKTFLQNFLRKIKIKSYQQYLKVVLDSYFELFSGTFSFTIPENAPFLKVFYDTFASDFGNTIELENAILKLPDEDFKLIRSKPLCKRQDGSYYSMHHNFYVDKLFQGLVFDFYNMSEISQLHNNSLPSFLGFLGEFSEKELFYKYLTKCFKGKYIEKIPGDRYDFEYSDYYVRDGKSMFLFEFKNVRMSAVIKNSKDFLKIRKGIISKLVTNERGKAKGVSQLFNVIKNVLLSPFDFDNFQLKKIGVLKIYPIIVYTDDFFEVDGIQKILTDEFYKLTSKSCEFANSKHKIHDVTLIHLEDIVDIGSQVNVGSVKFRELINKHLSRRKKIKKDKLWPSLELNQYKSYRVAERGLYKSSDLELRNDLKEAIGEF